MEGAADPTGGRAPPGIAIAGGAMFAPGVAAAGVPATEVVGRVACGPVTCDGRACRGPERICPGCAVGTGLTAMGGGRNGAEPGAAKGGCNGCPEESGGRNGIMGRGAGCAGASGLFSSAAEVGAAWTSRAADVSPDPGVRRACAASGVFSKTVFSTIADGDVDVCSGSGWPAMRRRIASTTSSSSELECVFLSV